MQNGVPRATGRPKAVMVLSPRKREQLESLASSRALHAGRVRRARIILLSAPGKTNMQIARQMGLTNATLGKWRRRFLEQDVSSLHAQKPSLAIRRDNQLVFRRPGSGKTSDRPMETARIPTITTRDIVVGKWPCQAALSQVILSPTKIRMSVNP